MQTETESTPRRTFRWGFFSASAVILALMVVGQFVGNIQEGLVAHRTEWSGRETLLVVVLAGFVLSSAVFLWLQWESVTRFFRTMQTGVALVSLSLLAVFAGVLVPQIENFEDATERVPSVDDIPDETFFAYLRTSDERDSTLPPEQLAAAQRSASTILAGLNPDQRERLYDYRAQYMLFRWAEGYFVYHLIHPYGIGMPKQGDLPQSVLDGLERFGKKYGTEERDNRRKQMKAAFGGRAIAQEIGQMIRDHESWFRAGFDVATKLHLNRTYKSHWFATLMALVCVGVGFNTFRGKPETWLSTRKMGFMCVHLGVMTLLVGGAISKAQSVRGILHMDLREGPRDTFWAYFDQTKLRAMPFHLKLDRFARRDWKTLEVVFPAEQFTSQPPQYTLWPGRKVDLDFARDASGVERPRIRLEVVSVHERALVQPSDLVEGGPGAPSGMGPMATLAVTAAPPAEGAATTTQHYLAPERPDMHLLYDPAARFRLLCDYGDDLATAGKLLADVDEGRLGWLSMRVASSGDVEAIRVPVKLGQTVSAPGGFTLRIVRATPRFRFDAKTMKEIPDDRPIAEVYPANPAVFVEIQGADGTVEERPVLERLDYDDAGLQKGFRHGGLVLNFTWDPWNAPGPERVVLHWDPSGKATVVASDLTRTPVPLGGRLPLAGETRVVLAALFQNAKVDRRITLDPAAPAIQGPHFDASFYSTEPTGVEVKVTTHPDTPEEKSEIATLASTETAFANFWAPGDKRFYLHYYLNDRAQPFEWRSVLSVWKQDAKGQWAQVEAGREEDREIRVNDYFHHQGYRFFQTNAIPELPTYSGIGVVYDPGIPIVLFGMYLTILGSLLAFVVRPIVEAYGKRTRAATVPGSTEP